MDGRDGDQNVEGHAVPPNPVKRLRYTGQRLTADGTKLCHRFQDADGDACIFTPKKASHWLIGRWYDVEQPTPDTYLLGGAKLVSVDDAQAADWAHGREADDDEVAGWRLASVGARERIAEVRARKALQDRAKTDGRDLRDVTLSDIRDAYRGHLPDYRAGMLTAVIRYITEGRI